MRFVGARRTLLFTPAVAAAAASYTANAVRFDGTNDYLTRGADLTGFTDGKTGIVSFWIDFKGGNATLQIILANTTNRLLIDKDAANKFLIRGQTSAATIVLSLASNSTYTTASGWKHVLASWDLAAGLGHLYISDADDLAASPTLSNFTIDNSSGDFAIGANTAGASKTNADIADFFLHNTYLDITVQANRRLFINASLKPVDLGANGSTPLGVQPLLFLSGATASWETNLGTGGGFTENGALTDGSSSPST